jgi:hypothetical protein
MTTSIKDELINLQKEHDGLLQVETIVEWAEQHPDSELYKSLEWDNEKAGHDWRCHQVRRLIAVHVISVDRVREMVSLSIDRHHDGGGYRWIATVMATSNMRQVLLQDALAELERVRKKYESLTELAQVWMQAEKVKQKHSVNKKKEERKSA